MRRDIARGTTDITRAKMWAYHAGHAFGHYVLFPLLFDIRVRGLEHVPPDGPCILAANHVSNFDPLLVGSYIPRTTTFVAKQELYKATILALLWYLWGAVKVRRDGLDMGPLRMLLRILADGGTVCMFPEGTRSRGRGLQPPVPGAAYLAVKSRAQVVPVAISGTETFDLKSRLLHGRARVDINVGEAFTPDVPAGNLKAAALEQVSEDVMRRIAALLPERMRGVYATSPAGAIDA